MGQNRPQDPSSQPSSAAAGKSLPHLSTARKDAGLLKSTSGVCRSKKDLTFESLIGEGAMSKVYRSRIRSSGEIVAVKTIKKSLASDPSLRKTLLDEVAVLKSQRIRSHPNVVTLHSSFQDELYLYYVLSMCPCGTLGDLIRRLRELIAEIIYKEEAHFQQRNISAHNQTQMNNCVYSISVFPVVPLPLIVHWVSAVLDVFVTLGQHNIVHRDVKPDNIFLSKNYDAVVGDFNSVLTNASDPTFSTSVDHCVGSPAYWSPSRVRFVLQNNLNSEDENASNESQSALSELSKQIITSADPHESDYWALGCVMFELLMGYNPFHRDKPEDTCRAILNFSRGDFELEFDPSIPADIIEVCNSLLSVDRSNKPFFNSDPVFSPLNFKETLRKYLDEVSIFTKPVDPRSFAKLILRYKQIMPSGCVRNQTELLNCISPLSSLSSQSYHQMGYSDSLSLYDNDEYSEGDDVNDSNESGKHLPENPDCQNGSRRSRKERILGSTVESELYPESGNPADIEHVVTTKQNVGGTPYVPRPSGKRRRNSHSGIFTNNKPPVPKPFLSCHLDTVEETAAQPDTSVRSLGKGFEESLPVESSFSSSCVENVSVPSSMAGSCPSSSQREGVWVKTSSDSSCLSSHSSIFQRNRSLSVFLTYSSTPARTRGGTVNLFKSESTKIEDAQSSSADTNTKINNNNIFRNDDFEIFLTPQSLLSLQPGSENHSSVTPRHSSAPSTSPRSSDKSPSSFSLLHSPDLINSLTFELHLAYVFTMRLAAIAAAWVSSATASVMPNKCCRRRRADVQDLAFSS